MATETSKKVESSESEWHKISDKRIQHVWRIGEHDHCDMPKRRTAVVSPNWYEHNGIPRCQCGRKYKYSHTKVLRTDEAS